MTPKRSAESTDDTQRPVQRRRRNSSAHSDEELEKSATPTPPSPSTSPPPDMYHPYSTDLGRRGFQPPPPPPPQQSRAGPSRSAPLNRAFACFACRKRKSRCDGTRPSCEQCNKAKTQCEYDDRPPRRPTDVLKDRIKELETQLRQMEVQYPGIVAATSSNNTSPAPSLTGQAVPLSVSGGAQPSPSYAQPAFDLSPNYAGYQRLPHSNVRAGSEPTPIVGNRLLPELAHPPHLSQSRQFSTLSFETELAAPVDPLDDSLPAGLNQRELIQIFLDHRHQTYFDISVPRLWQTINTPRPPPISQQPYASDPSTSSSSTSSSRTSPPIADDGGIHPALMNAIYLLACFFSSSSPPLTSHGSPHSHSSGTRTTSPQTYELAQFEPLFLARARRSIAASLERADRLLQAVQASSLVSIYLHAKGRVLEGYYLSCATARFAVGCGLHKLDTPVWNGGFGAFNAGLSAPAGAGGSTDGVPLLKPARDPIELGERIQTWWQVWMVDQLAAISTNLPPALYDSQEPSARFDTCWPPEMDQFEKGLLQIGSGVRAENLRSLYVKDSAFGTRSGPEGEGRRSIIAKATELFSRAWKLSKHDVKDESFRTAFAQTNDAIRAFQDAIPPFDSQEDTLVSPLLILPHSFVLAATIQLHWIIAVEHDHMAPSYQACLNAATEMLRLLSLMDNVDFGSLEMHVGVCWKLTEDVLIREVIRLRNAKEIEEADWWHQQFATIQAASTRLGKTYPVVAEMWRLTHP